MPYAVPVFSTPHFVNVICSGCIGLLIRTDGFNMEKVARPTNLRKRRISYLEQKRQTPS
ncbi:hypothetical protein DL93DRAFT_2085812 [Clavulina sp. PMI_390]|nr:hypothetical protein DL93DRAFT_2085812 [Clavulina sp. PMI_390]